MGKRGGKKRAQPLRGRTILVTRARAQAEALSGQLRRLGARVLEVPVIEFAPPRSWRPLAKELHRLASYDWLILTSANGVRTLLVRLRKEGIPKNQLCRLRSGPKIAAIGPATRAALAQAGISVTVMPKEYVAESVAAALAGRVRGKRVLLVRAAVARDVLPRALRRAGAQVRVVAAYQTRIPKSARRQLLALARNRAGQPDLVTCTSSSTVKNFLLAARGVLEVGRIAFASIGPITSRTLRQHGLRPAVEARSYTVKGLVAAIVSWAEQAGGTPALRTRSRPR